MPPRPPVVLLRSPPGTSSAAKSAIQGAAVSLLDRRLILVLGKGGVGRTTVAASLGLACAQRGRKTLLYQAHATDRMGGYFGRPPIGPSIAPLGDRLYGVNPSPASAIREYALMTLKFQRVYELVFENRLSQGFLRAIPGLDEYALLGKAWYHATERKGGQAVWDTVVMDLPASGHSLSLLRVTNVIRTTVPEGPLTKDARAILALLQDPAQCAAVVVTLAEEMPFREATELTAALRQDLGIEVAQVVVNQLYPTLGTAARTLLPAMAHHPALTGVADHAALVQARRQINDAYLAELRAAFTAPIAQLPKRFGGALGTSDIAAFAELLRQA